MKNVWICVTYSTSSRCDFTSYFIHGGQCCGLWKPALCALLACVVRLDRKMENIRTVVVRFYCLHFFFPMRLQASCIIHLLCKSQSFTSQQHVRKLKLITFQPRTVHTHAI